MMIMTMMLLIFQRGKKNLIKEKKEIEIKILLKLRLEKKQMI